MVNVRPSWPKSSWWKSGVNGALNVMGWVALSVAFIVIVKGVERERSRVGALVEMMREMDGEVWVGSDEAMVG